MDAQGPAAPRRVGTPVARASWSTRELADLAGTTVGAVRRYHARGLLERPARHANGDESYGAEHLVQLLRLRRMREVGVPIAEIAGLESGERDPDDVLAQIDARLAAAIDGATAARAELAVLARAGARAHAIAEAARQAGSDAEPA